MAEIGNRIANESSYLRFDNPLDSKRRRQIINNIFGENDLTSNFGSEDFFESKLSLLTNVDDNPQASAPMEALLASGLAFATIAQCIRQAKWSANVIPLRHARCEVNCSSAGQVPIARANSDALLAIFNEYASKVKDGVRYMTAEDFIRRYLGLYTDDNYNRETVRILAGAADTTKDGDISFEEFSAFESVLCSPDALYLTAFEVFDKNASASITCDEFEKIIRHTKPLAEMDFDFNSDFIKRYFGRDRKRSLGYLAFCQLLHDFYEELGKQAFKKYDKSADGTISSVDFLKIMTTVKRHLVTDFVRKNLVAVSRGDDAGDSVTYPYYMAFNSLLTQMELMKRIFVSNAHGNMLHEMTREEFLNATKTYPQITPYEVEILFKLAEAAHPGKKTLSLSDIECIDPQRLKLVSYIPKPITVETVSIKEERSVVTALLESAYRFTVGSVAGACGATAVYPIDLVKTRMQNQRSGPLVGEVAYKHSFDCFKKVVKFEGILGLYRGLLPQIIGVAPEKAIKLTVNDTIRDKFTVDGHIPLWAEILAGGCGGASQVIFTNPLEIVKIRLQVAGEVKTATKVSVLSVVRDLGLFGLYKGAKACFLRDIPFSAIYFPVYAHSKLLTADSDGHNGPGSLFASAFIAGVPAAALVTPADVIKTRLQVAARAGQTTYDSLLDCARKVMREEGPRAFWKGTAARVCRSSPQFAVTLFAYELLQRIFYVDFGSNRPLGSEISVQATTDVGSSNPEHIGGYRLAAATFSGIEHKFGLFMPRFELSGTK